MAATTLQSAQLFQPVVSVSKTSPPSSPTHRVRSQQYVATRLQCIANYKLRLTASLNEPPLRKLLGHIYVYDAVREHQQANTPPQIYTSTSPHASRRREQQLRRRQQSETTAATNSLNIISEEVMQPSQSDSLTSTLPSPNIPPSQAAAFAAFQSAIASQLETLSQLRVQAASRQLYRMTLSDINSSSSRSQDEDDEIAVEEYNSDDDTDCGADSDYDSFDSDDEEGANWRFDDEGEPGDELVEDMGMGDSDTDADSGSEPPSPTMEEPMSKKACSAGAGDGYFVGVGACVDVMC